MAQQKSDLLPGEVVDDLLPGETLDEAAIPASAPITTPASRPPGYVSPFESQLTGEQSTLGKNLGNLIYRSPVGEQIHKAALEYTTPKLSDQDYPWAPYAKGFVGGIGEAGANLATTPANWMMGLGGPKIQTAVSAGQIHHGGQEIGRGEYAQGALDIGTGVLGGAVGARAHGQQIANEAAIPPPTEPPITEPIRPTPTPEGGAVGQTTRLSPTESARFKEGSIEATGEYPPVKKPRGRTKPVGTAPTDMGEFNEWERYRDSEMSAGRLDPGPLDKQAISKSKAMVPYQAPESIVDQGDIINPQTGEVLNQYEPIHPDWKTDPEVIPDLLVRAQRAGVDVTKYNDLDELDNAVSEATSGPKLQDYVNQGEIERKALMNKARPMDLPITGEEISGTPNLKLKPPINTSALQEPGGLPSKMAQPELTHPTAQQWDARMKELDAKGAPDTAYRDIMSTAGKNALKKGETWRGKVQEGINYFESLNQDLNRPSEMRVPGVREGNTGLENIAAGGADERVLDVLGTALYTRDRPSTIVKELLQNSGDELKISGSKGPIRIGFRFDAKNPTTNVRANSIIVKDFGRGMGPEDLYTIFTDVGKTGKGKVVDASGGFGFAKAAPLLGGDHVKVESIYKDNNGKKFKYTFEGNPKQLKTQTKGVPLNEEEMDPSTPTGFKVEVFFPADKSLHQAQELLKNTVKGTPDLKGIEVFDDYNTSRASMDEFLEKGNFSSYTYGNIEQLEGEPIPVKQATISTPGADVDIHYELDNKERNQADLIYLNNGLYALQTDMYYGRHPMPHVPGKIVANIKSTVEEGEEGYPFAANREALNRNTSQAIDKWIKENITENAENIRLAELQKVFDDLAPAPGNNHVVHDSGKRYTPQELRRVEQNKSLRNVAWIMESMLNQLDVLFPVGSKGGQVAGTAKFGYIISDPGAGGINIPAPQINAPNNKFAVMVNALGFMKEHPPEEAAEKIAHAILHEFNHNKARNEGADFTWKLLETDAKYTSKRRAKDVENILKSISGDGITYTPELQTIIDEYTAARGRPDTEIDTLSRQSEGSYIGKPGSGTTPSSGRPNGRRTSREKRPTPTARVLDQLDEMNAQDESYQKYSVNQEPLGPGETWRDRARAGGGGVIPPRPPSSGGSGRGSGGNRKPPRPEIPPSNFRAWWELTRGMVAADFPYVTSAALRQSVPLFMTKPWRQAFNLQAQAFHGEKLYEDIQKELLRHPIRQPRYEGGVLKPSVWDQLKMPKNNDFNRTTARQDAIRKSIQERFWVIGRYYSASNRSFNAFQEAIRTYALDEFLKRRGAMTPNGTIVDLPLAQKLANTVKELTGYGSLTYQVPFTGRMGISQSEANLEKAGDFLSEILWTPRQLVRDARMMNPLNYVMSTKLDRLEYMKGAARRLAVWFGSLALAHFFLGAKVNWDPSNSDFGKARIKNTRLDPGSGLAQWFVLIGRNALGYTTSSSTKIRRELGSSPVAPNRVDTGVDFLGNRLHPSLGYIYGAGRATKDAPFYPLSELAERAVMFPVADMDHLMKTDPDFNEIVLGMVGAVTSMGTLTYGRKDYGKPEYKIPGDAPFKGGKIFDIELPK